MGIVNFITVLALNVFLIKNYGVNAYLDAYSFKHAGYLSISMWFTALWGVANLIYAIYNAF